MSTDKDPKVAANEAAVRAFLKGWDDLDVDQCMAQAADNICYLNQPLEAIRGKKDVRHMIASIFEPAHKAEFILLNVFGKGNRVITERLDQWDWNGSGTWQLKLPVCGMFELTEDHKIVEWREYYDNEHWTKYGGPSLVL